MLNAFLMWRRDPDFDPDPQEVATRLRALFTPLLPDSLSSVVRREEGASMVFLYASARGWRPSSFEVDEADPSSWALAPDYPCGAPAALSRGGLANTDRVLLPLHSLRCFVRLNA